MAIVNAPVWDTGTPPLGIAYLLAAVRGAGFEASAFDYNLTVWKLNREQAAKGGVDYFDNENFHYFSEEALFREQVLPVLRESIDELVTQICAYEPDVIGFCVRFSSFPCVQVIAAACRAKLPRARIIIGGPEASWANAENINFQMTNSPIEAAVLGEGEATLVEVLGRWQAGYPLDGCRGIIHRRHDGIVVQEEMREQIPITALARPQFADFDFSQYRIPNAISISLSRGCVAKCTFCSETRFWQKYRFRAAADVYGEIAEFAATYGIQEIVFGDSLVNGNFRVLEELMDLLTAGGAPVQWGGFCRVDDRLTREFLLRMKAAGCRYLMFGFESGSQKVADLMKKNAKVETAKRVLRDCHEVGISAHICVIAGFPGEEEEDFEATMEFLRENGKYAGAIYVNEMNLLLGTPVRETPELYGISASGPLGVNDWSTEDGRNTPAIRAARLARLKEFVATLR